MTRALAKWALGMFRASRDPQAAWTSAQGKTPRTAIRGLQTCGPPESPPDTVRSANHFRYEDVRTVVGSKWISWVSGANPTGRRCALVLVFLLAILVRLSFLGHDSLSHAEASRANFAWSTSLEGMRFFPPLH